MIDPVAKAKWVLKMKGISDIPALSLGEIAKQEDIKYCYCDFPDDPLLDGILLYKGSKRAIVVNTCIGNTGKHHFTFAHELGHYFLEHPPSHYKDGQPGFRCTSDDIKKAHKPREAEANSFAVELLMPRDRFHLDMIGAPLDFGLINGLSNRYMVSKHACSNRILDLTHSPSIVIRTKSNQITGWSTSRAAKGYLRRMDVIPEDTYAHWAIIKKSGHDDFIDCDAGKWLVRAVPSLKVYECTHVHTESGHAMTILKW